MEFDWNPAKCSKNIADRGIDFADVLVGFIDPARKVVRDDRKDYGRGSLQHARQSQRTCLPHHLYRTWQDSLDNFRAKSQPTGAAAL
jgi:uncharacterized DUF497 family protein